MTLTADAANRAVAKFALMPFFPSDPDIRAALVSIFLEMIESKEQLEWLVNRAVPLYGNWPGVGEIRALYCSRWKPKDGIEAYSIIYPGGIPSERNQQRKFDAPRGHPVTTDADLEAKVQKAADAKKLRGGIMKKRS